MERQFPMNWTALRYFQNDFAKCGLLLCLVLFRLPVAAAPNAPTNLLAAAVSSVQVSLTWSDSSSDETGFKIERSRDGTNYSQVAQVLANTTGYRDKGAWPGVNYFYRVRSFDSSGSSDYSQPAGVATPALCSANVFGWGYSPPPAGLTGMVAVATGGNHGLALKTDGTVMGWGANDFGEATPPVGLTGVVALSASPYLSLALKSDGTVVGWGYNGAGETTPPPGLSGVVAIAAGGAYGLALRNDGTVVGWGFNNHGQASPPAGLKGVIAIAAGEYHGLALKSDGTVVGWGHNPYGGATVPPGLGEVVAIAAGEFHSVALLRNGAVVAWGYNSYGQTNVPAGLANVIEIGAGSLFSVAVKSDGSNVAWGIPGPSAPPEGLTGGWFLSANFRHCLVISCAPFAPGALSASAIASNRIDLAWADNAADETGFNIERAADLGGVPGAWVNIANVGANVTAYSDTTALPSTKYWYRVGAFNAGGNSPYGNQASVATPPLAAPTNLRATTVSATRVNLVWADNSATEDGFKIERAPDTAGVPGAWSEVGAVGAGVTNYSDTGLVELTRYWFSVRAYSAGADSAPGNPVSAVTQLGAPSNFAATAVAFNQVNLSWADNSALEDGFKIERANTPTDQSWFPIGTNPPNVSVFTYTNANCSQTYHYRVHAFLGQTRSAFLSLSNSTALVDTDGDGVTDCWTLKYFGHATGRDSDNSRADDSADGDGVSNLQEFLAGTNPTNAASFLRIITTSVDTDGARVSWTTAGGRKYVVQTNSAPGSGFGDLSPIIAMPGNAESQTNYLDVGATNWPARYYRIRIAQ